MVYTVSGASKTHPSIGIPMPEQVEHHVTDLSLSRLIESRAARVSVVGIGYAGLPLAVALARTGFQVVGLDIDETKVQKVNEGVSYIEDVAHEDLMQVTHSLPAGKRLSASSDFSVLDSVDVVIITVPTPLSKTRHPDLSYVVSAIDSVANHVHKGMLVVLQSTTYPGTTEEMLVPRLAEGAGESLTIGEDYFVAFAPERIDPGRKDWTFATTPKVVGGHTPACLKVASQLFATVVETVVPVESPGEAEMVKLLENTFRATNIALVNEVAIMCDRLGLNVWNVIDAAATKPYGFMKFTPGPGIGGHCIPADPQYLAWKLRSLNYEAKFVGLAEEINIGMQSYVLEKIAMGLNSKRLPISGSKILCLGVSYKPDISDVRDSPAIELMRVLAERGGIVSYNDPFVPHMSEDGFDRTSVDLTEEALREADCTIIFTSHSQYDWQRIAKNSTLVVDTRNALKDVQAEGCEVVSI